MFLFLLHLPTLSLPFVYISLSFPYTLITFSYISIHSSCSRLSIPSSSFSFVSLLPPIHFFFIIPSAFFHSLPFRLSFPSRLSTSSSSTFYHPLCYLPLPLSFPTRLSLHPHPFSFTPCAPVYPFSSFSFFPLSLPFPTWPSLLHRSVLFTHSASVFLSSSFPSASPPLSYPWV